VILIHSLVSLHASSLTFNRSYEELDNGLSYSTMVRKKRTDVCTRLELSPCFLLHIVSEFHRKFSSQQIYKSFLMLRAFDTFFFFPIKRCNIKFVFDLILDKIQSRYNYLRIIHIFLLHLKMISQSELIIFVAISFSGPMF